MSAERDPHSPPLIPDPERLRARLADLAREQATLRKVLRAVVRGQYAGTPPQTPGERGPHHAA
jgi:hypothetical protein